MEILHFESQMATVLYSLQNMANNNQISMKEKALIKGILFNNFRFTDLKRLADLRIAINK